jgi:hypothetical protein
MSAEYELKYNTYAFLNSWIENVFSAVGDKFAYYPLMSPPHIGHLAGNSF